MYCVSDLYGTSSFAKINESREEDFRDRRKMISLRDYRGIDGLRKSKGEKGDDHLRFIDELRM